MREAEVEVGVEMEVGVEVEVEVVDLPLTVTLQTRLRPRAIGVSPGIKIHFPAASSQQTMQRRYRFVPTRNETDTSIVSSH